MKIVFENINSKNNVSYKPINKSKFYITNASEINSRDIVCFTGAKPKRINVEAEKEKLLKSITKILETNSSSKKTKFDKDRMSMRELLFLDAKDRKMDFLIQQQRVFASVAFANPTMMYETSQSLWKEARKATKDANNYKSKVKNNEVTKTDESWDYTLLNKFKNALLNNNFDLETIMKDHYQLLSRLNKMNDIEASYPNLKTVLTPEENIVQNIIKGLDRSFFEKLYELRSYDNLAIANLYKFALEKACTGLKIKDEQFLEDFQLRIASLFVNRAEEKYSQCIEQGTFSSIPEHTKKAPLIATPLDLDLMQIDFDKFVLNVYSQQFIDMKKFNDIVYEENGIKIPLKKLANTPYKFEKLSEKLKTFIKDATILKLAQRDYDNFTNEELKSRLNHFANHPACDDDRLFELIMEFYSCAFLSEDIANLKIFLRELDLIIDKKKSLVNVVSDITSKKIKPHGTLKQNEAERKLTYEKIKEEQQKTYELLAKQEEFDKVINTLYTLQMNSVAAACADFRPQTLEDKTNIKRAEFLVNYINSNIIDGKIPNKNVFENDIFHWGAYHKYKSSSEYNKYPKFIELITNAEKYATENGSINEIKAGQYIYNMELIDSFPESADIMDNPEILKRIMEKTNGDKKQAFNLLIKYNQFYTLPDNEQSSILKILEVFDERDFAEKAIIKELVDSVYLDNDTKIVMTESRNGSNETVIITKEAKQDIYDKHKFPSCLEYFEAFESASQNFAGDVGSSGVKRMGGSNQALAYKYEIKIKGYPDRLFSSQNDYKFDVYSEKGLH